MQAGPSGTQARLPLVLQVTHGRAPSQPLPGGWIGSLATEGQPHTWQSSFPFTQVPSDPCRTPCPRSFPPCPAQQMHTHPATF